MRPNAPLIHFANALNAPKPSLRHSVSNTKRAARRVIDQSPHHRRNEARAQAAHDCRVYVPRAVTNIRAGGDGAGTRRQGQRNQGTGCREAVGMRSLWQAGCIISFGSSVAERGPLWLRRVRRLTHGRDSTRRRVECPLLRRCKSATNGQFNSGLRRARHGLISRCHAGSIPAPASIRRASSIGRATAS